MSHHPVGRLIPGERVLWDGRPDWRAVARDVLHIGWLALYLAAMLIWGAFNDRQSGLGPAATLLGEVPLFLVGCAVLGACAGFAVLFARTTRYTVTSERLILHYGVALTATLSLPLRRIAGVSVSPDGDGTADILLALKPGGRRLRFVQLWPHVRPWRFSRARPMLRGVPGGKAVAMLLSQAVAGVAPGVLHAAPAAKPARKRVLIPALAANPSGAPGSLTPG